MIYGTATARQGDKSLGHWTDVSPRSYDPLAHDTREIARKALDNVKNQFELDLWYNYKSSISTLSYNGEIIMRGYAIESFKIQFDI
jgi:hypothetical protein